MAECGEANNRLAQYGLAREYGAECYLLADEMRVTATPPGSAPQTTLMTVVRPAAPVAHVACYPDVRFDASLARNLAASLPKYCGWVKLVTGVKHIHLVTLR